MRKILSVIAVLLVVPFAAHADFVKAGDQVHATLVPTQVQFSYYNQNLLASCDYVQELTEQTLRSLGARNIKVECTGGLQEGNTPNFVTANFTAVHEADAAKSTMMGTVSDVALSADESCDLHRAIYANVVKSFQVYAQTENDSCWDSQGQFEARLQLLK